MPVFDTPEPISVVVGVVVGDVDIAASDRVDTVVEVRPTDPSRGEDVRAAEQTRVGFARGTLVVKAPRSRRPYRPFSHSGSIDVVVEVPAGSRVTGSSALGPVRCSGPLGDCVIKTAASDIHIDHAAAVRLATASGDITIDHASGDADLTTAGGAVRAGEIDGAIVIKNSGGDTHVDEIGGDVVVKSGRGDIRLGHAHGSVSALTGKGNIRVGGAERGSVVAETGYGEVEVGIVDGTAAWLDLETHFGQVHNGLDRAGAPRPEEGHVEVRVRTGYGDITIRRS
jgi:DUF4097 and DUF4098 domain-containing protein YvlB